MSNFAEESKGPSNGTFSFGFNKEGKKNAREAKQEQRRKLFLKETDTEDLKRKRDDKHVSLRKEAKKQKFQRRRMANYQGTTAEETKEQKIETFTVEEADSMWQEGMDIMEYFKILAKTHFELPHFLTLLELVCSKEDRKILFGVVGIRKLLSLIDNPPIQNVIDSGLLPVLISLVGRTDFPRLQFEVLWCLTNIASGKADHVQALIDKGAIKVFIHCLQSEHQNIREQAIWALGNIAGEDVFFKNLIIEDGALKPLIGMLNTAEPDSMLARNTVWCCTNLLRGKPLPPESEILFAIPVYCKVLKNNTRKEILTDAMWGLSYMSDSSDKAVVKILESGACEHIVGLLQSKHNNIVLPAIRALGNFVTGEDTETQTVMDSGAIPNLHALLEHEDPAIRKEACWTISNICAGTTTQIAVVIESGIMDKLVSIVYSDVYEVQREAGWSISNATALKNSEIIAKIVESKGIEAIMHVLKQKVDPKTCVVLLEGIKNILMVGQTQFLDENGENPFTIFIEECGGIDVLESCQGHQNQHVYELAVKILEQYFALEEVDLSQTNYDEMKLEF